MHATDLNRTSGQMKQAIERLLGASRTDAAQTFDETKQAIDVARLLCQRARELQTPAERRQQAELDRMINSPHDKATMMQLTDQAFRSRRAHRAADQLIHILDVQGVPRFFSALDRTLLLGFQSFGSYLPGVAMPFVKERMHQETANVILPAERDLLAAHLRARWQEGVRMNVNFLGEALLGEGDAERRLQSYLTALQQPEIEVISVKISTIYSQISALAREHTIGVLCDRLELLFRAATKATFTRPDGTQTSKFVYLDMEEYRDKEITAEAFIRTLDRPKLSKARAGIALQAYIPDSFATQQRINAWARRRVASGGSPVTIRLVKGANMEAERVEASLRGWPQAPYKSKPETDANYLRMLREGMRPENLAAVHLGIASHNLFSLAYGLVLAVRAGAMDRVQFEMLEGMANAQRRALFDVARNMLLYAPACRQEEFINAIGYLVRRLDENTGPNNFLRYAFSVEVDSPTWKKLEQQFIAACAAIDEVASAPRRSQNRATEIRGSRAENPPLENLAVAGSQPSAFGALRFRNEPDTDWSLPPNSEWAESIVERWRERCNRSAPDVPLVIDGEEIFENRPARESTDPSRPGVVVARWRQASEGDIQAAVRCAQDDSDGWRGRGAHERTAILNRAAEEIARARGDLMGAMLAEGGKTLAESDPEVSEAIDFCRFYAATAECFYTLAGTHVAGRGVVAVVSPWNFPLAIPCGGVAAALAAGNCVILKPASDTVLIAYALCHCFWRAGVPKTALQFAPCRGDNVAQTLVTHDGVDAVILTGGTSTAATMLRVKPTMHLLAETGGKNATIVTALADRDQAIKNVLHSALSHSGQKCSATSLLILESEVFHDDRFRETLCDAVESLVVGSSWNLETKIGPLIRPPSGALETALKELEAGEEWAVMPRLHVDGNPHLVGPAVKWNVQAGSMTHCTELFGPVLGVMEARDLDHAIELVNATGYGLTSGLESLDDREQSLWRERVLAGNLYINRSTTGAIVLRQPFGGMGKSCVGPGIKAGGPNYVAPLMRFTDDVEAAKATSDLRTIVDSPILEESSEVRGLDRVTRLGGDANEGARIARSMNHLESLLDELRGLNHKSCGVDVNEIGRVLAAIVSYAKWAREEFLVAHDHFQLLGEDNFRCYVPAEPLRVRVHRDDTFFEIFARAAAARAVGCRVIVSTPARLDGTAVEAVALLDRLTDAWAGAIEFVDEDEARLVDALRGAGGTSTIGAAGAVRAASRMRYAHPERVPREIRNAAAESLEYIADTRVSAHGRIELLWYVREQSVSSVYHRYGNLGLRADETRDEPA